MVSFTAHIYCIVRLTFNCIRVPVTDTMSVTSTMNVSKTQTSCRTDFILPKQQQEQPCTNASVAFVEYETMVTARKMFISPFFDNVGFWCCFFASFLVLCWLCQRKAALLLSVKTFFVQKQYVCRPLILSFCIVCRKKRRSVLKLCCFLRLWAILEWCRP